jgi:hypothetical protein
MITSAVFIITALAALAVTLSVAMAFPSPLRAEAAPPEGWASFSSSEVYPASSEAAFTISYPPGFMRGFDDEQEGGFSLNGTDRMDNFEFQSFTGPVSKSGSMAVITVSGDTLGAAETEFISQHGHESFLETLGRSTAGAVGVFDGADLFSFKGNPAADIFIHDESGQDGEDDEAGRDGREEDQAAFVLLRPVFKGSHILTFTCLYVCLRADAEKAGYTSRDNPAVGKYFRPFLDSLEFVR